MDFKERLNKIADGLQKVLNSKIEMVEINLADGELLQADKLEVGESINYVKDDKTIPAPDATYESATGQLIVTKDGKIESIKDQPTEEDESEIVTSIVEAVKASSDELTKTLMSKINEESELRKALEVKLSESEAKVKETNDLMKQVLSAIDEIKDAPAEKPTRKPLTMFQVDESYGEKVRAIKEMKSKVNN